jgi:hypothetical protein
MRSTSSRPPTATRAEVLARARADVDGSDFALQVFGLADLQAEGKEPTYHWQNNSRMKLLALSVRPLAEEPKEGETEPPAPAVLDPRDLEPDKAPRSRIILSGKEPM